MPIDTSIYGQLRTNEQPPDLLRNFALLSNIKGSQQAQQFAAEDQAMQRETNRVQRDAAERAMRDSEIESQARLEAGGDLRKISFLMAKRGASGRAISNAEKDGIEVLEKISKLDGEQIKQFGDRLDLLGKVSSGMVDEPSYVSGIQEAVQGGLISPEQGSKYIAAGWTPETQAEVKRFRERALSAKDAVDLQIKRAEARERVSTNAFNAMERQRHDKAMEEAAKKNPTEAALAMQAAGNDPAKALDILAKQAQAKRPVVNVAGAGGGADDAKDIANAIIEGKQAPDLKGLYSKSAPIRAELARRGFNLATAQSDWAAMQRHLATLNGSQQERLRQAVNFTYDSLDLIEQNFEDLSKKITTTQFPVLNRVNLARLKQGLTTDKEAQALATNLEAQINDLTSELGTVYKGGNASTDETLRLAAENLRKDWSPTTFNAALKQIRQNLAIRRNSINTSQPVGVSASSPYNTMEKPTEASGSGEHTAAPVRPPTPKIGEIRKGHVFLGGDPALPASWKKVR